ncbi:hypothetical protein LOD99_11368 [Oopsacas minuta]|uniref:Uncharacterized protein n=1 Tax=Oopsacas minuta TaxID=111878 RepID=A0AAV7K5V2_9METZ|nr:hypothetical protein LOD99_11368 [Oopsacas minuta]
MTEVECILDGMTYLNLLHLIITWQNLIPTYRDDWETEMLEKVKGLDLKDSESYTDENEDSDKNRVKGQVNDIRQLNDLHKEIEKHSAPTNSPETFQHHVREATGSTRRAIDSLSTGEESEYKQIVSEF